MLLLAIACTDPYAEAATGTTGGPAETSGGPTSTESSSSGANDISETSTSSPLDTSTSGSSDDGGFIGRTDTHHNIECDIWAQRCREGEKCVIWASGESEYPNATRCVPVVRDPAVAGEPCTVSDSLYSGLDDCDASSTCYYVDARTLMGECAAFCEGTEANPVCTAPDEVCVVLDESAYTICRQTCDPLAQNCPSERSCVSMLDEFVCESDASGADGVYGDPCEFANACDPGFVCGAPEWVPGCVSLGCCTPFCDLTSPDPDAQCPGVDGGQACIAWFEEGQAPEGHEDVGVCAIPA